MRTLLASFAAMVLAGAAAAEACSCAPPPRPKKALEQAAAVFSGKVTKVEDAGEGEKVVTMQVAASWKGREEKEITLYTANNSAACGYDFKKGTSYLVYAHMVKRGEDKVLGANICTRTALLTEAKEDLKELGEGKKIR